MATNKTIHQVIVGIIFTATLGIILAPTRPVLARLPRSVDLAVPFTSQAPHANWAQPWQDACEEASALMVHAFFAKQTFTKDSANAELLKIVDWENTTFGDYKHTTAEQTAQMLREYFSEKKVRVVTNPTVTDLKNELAAGHPIIIPAAGRMLGNKNFTGAGPLYHMLVLRGYDWHGNFITNDPGTRRGQGFKYKEKILMNAIHDWHDENIAKGAKVVIVVEP